MLLHVLKTNRLLRLSLLLATLMFTICLVMGYFLMELSDKIQNAKIDLKQHQLDAEKIDLLFANYPKINRDIIWEEPEQKIVKKENSNKTVLKKEDFVQLLDIMEEVPQQTKIQAQQELENITSLEQIKNQIVYTINFSASETKRQKYMQALENIPFVSQIYELKSTLSMSNTEIIGLQKEEEIVEKIANQEKNSGKNYSLKLKVSVE